MFNFINLLKASQRELLSSTLFDETTFYASFISDLKHSKHAVIIESPHITTRRINSLLPVFRNLVSRGIKVVIITRDPQEHSKCLSFQAVEAIKSCKHYGIHVIICSGYHHRKLAIIDRGILWEGSLNILSQGYSREFMRRIRSDVLAKELLDYLALKIYQC
jgi:phosphatidylserine/phosphatidylglycerophosphate/cardiolipin synthase-like enzyme